jgi:hypothetical protein
MKGNGVRWLKELKTGKLTHYANEAAQYGHKVLDKLSELLTRVKGQIPEKFQNIITKVNDTPNTLAAGNNIQLNAGKNLELKA